MGLSEDEQRELNDIEQRLAEDDPAFAVKLATAPPRHPRLPRHVLRLIGLLLIYVVGLLMVMTGAVLSATVLIVLGSVVTAFGSVAIVVQARRGRGNRTSPV